MDYKSQSIHYQVFSFIFKKMCIELARIIRKIEGRGSFKLLQKSGSHCLKTKRKNTKRLPRQTRKFTISSSKITTKS